MTNIKQVQNKIKTLKTQLKKRCENFGAREQRELAFFIGDKQNYNHFEGSLLFQEFDGFCSWCRNYTGNEEN